MERREPGTSRERDEEVTTSQDGGVDSPNDPGSTRSASSQQLPLSTSDHHSTIGIFLQQSYQAIPWNSKVLQGIITLAILWNVIATMGGIFVVLLPAALLAYLYFIHPYLAAGTLMALLHWILLRGILYDKNCGGICIIILGFIDAGVALWCFHALLRPSTPESHWFLQLSYRLDTLLDPSGHRARNQSVAVAGVGAIAVLSLCFISLGLAMLVQDIRPYHSHPCEPKLKLPSDIPIELEEYIVDRTTLPERFHDTQHGTVYHSDDGTLYFTGTSRTRKTVRSQPVLYSYRESNRPSVLRVHEDIVNPNHFASVEVENGVIMCFLAHVYMYEIFCIDSDQNIQHTNKLHISPSHSTQVFGASGRL